MSIVVKEQLCGKYCEGCPHGPYAYRVTSDGNGGQEWEYLGKAGVDDGSGDDYESDLTKDEEEKEVVMDRYEANRDDPVIADISTYAGGISYSKLKDIDDDYTLEGLASANPSDLTQYDGIGEKSAEQIVDTARTLSSIPNRNLSVKEANKRADKLLDIAQDEDIVNDVREDSLPGNTAGNFNNPLQDITLDDDKLTVDEDKIGIKSERGRVLAHELGHALNKMGIDDQRLTNSDKAQTELDIIHGEVSQDNRDQYIEKTANFISQMVVAPNRTRQTAPTLVNNLESELDNIEDESKRDLYKKILSEDY